MVCEYNGFREVSAIRDRDEGITPKHLKREGVKYKHLKKESAKPKILKILIVAELLMMIPACSYIYMFWNQGVEALLFRHACSVTMENASGFTYKQTGKVTQAFLEGIAAEVYEYVWTTDKVEYRTGANISYKSAGTLDKDKLVRRTGITHGGWSRITVDGEDYYVPWGTLSEYTPEGLPIADGIKGEYQKYALSLLPDFGWSDSELAPLIYLWNRESGWNPNSHNRGSGAHGIPQALPASKMASEGSDYYTNAEPQIRWGLKYIAHRYGSPSAAWAHFCSRGWY